MKQTIKTSRAAGQLEKMFRTMNAHFFAGELPDCIISLKKTPGAYGHITTVETWTAGGKGLHEINISTATLDRPIEETAATLLHEMCHLFNMIHGIKDCSGSGNAYHNKKFKATAESHGLEIGHDSKYGWTITTPGIELLELVELQGWQSIQMTEGLTWWDMIGTGTTARTPGAADGGADKPPRKPSSTRKYICPKCGMSVRAT